MTTDKLQGEPQGEGGWGEGGWGEGGLRVAEEEARPKWHVCVVVVPIVENHVEPRSYAELVPAAVPASEQQCVKPDSHKHASMHNIGCLLQGHLVESQDNVPGPLRVHDGRQVVIIVLVSPAPGSLEVVQGYPLQDLHGTHDSITLR